MQIQGSPFIVSGPARPEEVIGRHEILAGLADRAARGAFVLLTAPRRYGKTTLIGRLAADAEATKDLHVVTVDLLGVQTLDDIALRCAQAWARLPQGPLARVAAAILPYVAGIDLAGGAVSLAVRNPQTPSLALESVLDVPRAVAERSGRRVLVVFDEFQAIADVPRADAIIRSQIQHQTSTTSYLFAGSEQSTLHMLFSDRARPLYGQAEHVELEPFPPDELADYLTRRFDDTARTITDEALRTYLDLTEGHPQRSMLLADCLWGTVDDGGSIDRPHLDAALTEALDRCSAEFDATWELLTDAQSRVLRLRAWDEPLTGAAAARLGLSQGSSRSGAETLRDRGILTDERRIIDPLLTQWVRRLGSRP